MKLKEELIWGRTEDTLHSSEIVTLRQLQERQDSADVTRPELVAFEWLRLARLTIKPPNVQDYRPLLNYIGTKLAEAVVKWRNEAASSVSL